MRSAIVVARCLISPTTTTWDRSEQVWGADGNRGRFGESSDLLGNSTIDIRSTEVRQSEFKGVD